MTILYRPVLIESVEQAEALPEGTLVLLRQSPHVIKCEDGAWRYAQGTGGALSKMLVGFTALVPIEAEEEWKTLHEGAWHLKADEDDARRDVNSLGARRRYTTIWEETP